MFFFTGRGGCCVNRRASRDGLASFDTALLIQLPSLRFWALSGREAGALRDPKIIAPPCRAMQIAPMLARKGLLRFEKAVLGTAYDENRRNLHSETRRGWAGSGEEPPRSACGPYQQTRAQKRDEGGSQEGRAFWKPS